MRLTGAVVWSEPPLSFNHWEPLPVGLIIRATPDRRRDRRSLSQRAAVLPHGVRPTGQSSLRAAPGPTSRRQGCSPGTPHSFVARIDGRRALYGIPDLHKRAKLPMVRKAPVVGDQLAAPRHQPPAIWTEHKAIKMLVALVGVRPLALASRHRVRSGHDPCPTRRRRAMDHRQSTRPPRIRHGSTERSFQSGVPHCRTVKSDLPRPKDITTPTALGHRQNSRRPAQRQFASCDVRNPAREISSFCRQSRSAVSRY